MHFYSLRCRLAVSATIDAHHSSPGSLLQDLTHHAPLDYIVLACVANLAVLSPPPSVTSAFARFFSQITPPQSLYSHRPLYDHRHVASFGGHLCRSSGSRFGHCTSNVACDPLPRPENSRSCPPWPRWTTDLASCTPPSRNCESRIHLCSIDCVTGASNHCD